MFFAINEKTKQPVRSMDIYIDPSYIEPYKDKWYAPESEILNIEELKEKGIKKIEVRYVKQCRKPLRKRKGTFLVRPHFNIIKKEELGIITHPQDLFHNKILNWIFNYILQEETTLRFCYSTYYINKKKKENIIDIKELNIDKLSWDREISIVGKYTKKNRADIYVRFKNRKLLFGEGIIFEIQLTKQTEKEIKERTLERGLKGYSVCWIFEKDFDIGEEEFILKTDTLKLIPHAEILKEYDNKKFEKWKNVVEENSRYIDKTILKQKEHFERLNKEKYKKQIEINKLFINHTKQFNEQKDYINKRLKEIKSKGIESFKEDIKDIIPKIDKDNILDEIKNYIKTQINQEFFFDISEKIESKIKLFEYRFNKQLEMFTAIEKIIQHPCPLCGKQLMIKERKSDNNKFIGCSGYKENRCTFIANIDEFNYYSK